MAPEVILQGYDAQADMWSVGMLMYQLLTGTFPFWDSVANVSLQQVGEASSAFPIEETEKQLAWLLVYIMSAACLLTHLSLYTTRLSHVHDSFRTAVPMNQIRGLLILDKCNAVCKKYASGGSFALVVYFPVACPLCCGTQRCVHLTLSLFLPSSQASL